MKPKLLYEFVKEYINKEGYKLLSTEYENNRSKLEVRCPKGHEYLVSYDSFKSGKRCKKCYNNKRKHSYEFVKNKIENIGYKLLSKEYINAQQKLKIRCDKEHEYEVRWYDFKEGKRCPQCFYNYNIGSNHSNWKGGISCEPYCEQWRDKEYKNSIMERDGYICLNPECSKTSDKLCIHHIDYNKKNCHPSNLITVCISCNSKANKDRRWHKAWYQAVIRKRYKGD